jgi:CheY-like chemotaxis protein
MTCPRCRAEIKGRPDAAGVVVCPACKAQLKVKVPGSMPPTPVGNITLPPGVRAPVPAPEKAAPASPAAATPAPKPPLATPTRSLGPAPAAARVEAGAAPSVPPTVPPPPAATPASLDDVLGEVKAVRGLQVEILSMLKAMASVHSASPAAPPPDTEEGFAPPPPTPVRSRRRKTVLVIDDDEQTRKAAAAALEQAEVPVRTVSDGNSGLEAMAAERPDVVVLELGMGGRMAGKDVVNLIKATMEWVDIPIVLYTRMAVDGQKEARLVHGADELVPKGAGAPEILVARVIALFRRG